jgi:hypothetical protein
VTVIVGDPKSPTLPVGLGGADNGPQYADLYRQMIVDHELGSDFSGPVVCVCRCPECQCSEGDLDHTRVSSEYANHVVREVRSGLTRRAPTMDEQDSESARECEGGKTMDSCLGIR